MLALLALSAALIQVPPAPPAPPAPPPPPPLEVHSRLVFVGGGGTDGLDKDGDGHVSREEFAAPLTDHFDRVDRDGDGRLSAEELSASGDVPGDHILFRRSGAEAGASRIEIRRPGTTGARTGSEVRTLIFSGRGEGAGSKREIEVRSAGGEGFPHIIRLPGGTGPGAHDVTVHRFDSPGGEHDMDADKDGRISEAEFTDPLRAAFIRMDTDRSGFIEQDERGQGEEVRVITHRVETRQNGED